MSEAAAVQTDIDHVQNEFGSKSDRIIREMLKMLTDAEEIALRVSI
jgi:hypothetical protein